MAVARKLRVLIYECLLLNALTEAAALALPVARAVGFRTSPGTLDLSIFLIISKFAISSLDGASVRCIISLTN
jgi:hypothetical protein